MKGIFEMKRPITILFAMAAAAPAVACASSPPPRELLDARAAYARVSVGDAPKLEPGAMHAARMALAAAEASYDDRASTYVTRDRAYVAYRKAELADVLASTSRIKLFISSAPSSKLWIRISTLRARLIPASQPLDHTLEMCDGGEPIAREVE